MSEEEKQEQKEEETGQPKEGAEPAEGKSRQPEQKPAEPGGPPWESELDVYPLREKSEDPRWAVRVVWVWLGVALTAFCFILTLLILGAVYD